MSERSRSLPKARWCWHFHHDRLVEVATEPIRRRRAYIRSQKPSSEVPIRLRLLRPVRGKLPAALTKAWDAYVRATDAAHQTWVAYLTAKNEEPWDTFIAARSAHTTTRDASIAAHEAYEKALRRSTGKIETLHRLECPNCPWDGRSIFPKKHSKEV